MAQHEPTAEEHALLDHIEALAAKSFTDFCQHMATLGVTIDNSSWDIFHAGYGDGYIQHLHDSKD